MSEENKVNMKRFLFFISYLYSNLKGIALLAMVDFWAFASDTANVNWLIICIVFVVVLGLVALVHFPGMSH